MKLRFLCLFILLALISIAPRAHSFLPVAVEVKQEKEVLICKSKGAYAYHSHYCRGLKNCKADVLKVSADEAVKMGRKACGYCYK